VGAERFAVGKNLAVTPGKVIYRNRLMELIQYEPTTPTVHAEPVLIIPAWIMKYYILDLSPENSLVRYLLSQGHQVFMISWKNPTSEDRDLGLKDYVDLGARRAIETVSDIAKKPIHCAGYCLGGTLSAIVAAAMARDHDGRLASLSLFAAQTDFTEAGELMMFIDEGQVSYLEDLMWTQGFLDARQMSGAFQLLRSNDLIWSRLVHDYLLGEREPFSDLMAWNADATRMPYRMHSEYLRKLFLDNELAEGRFSVDGRRVALEEIALPIFAVATERDHVAPWQSVFKIHTLTSADVTFLLASGGHNAGIVSEPGHAGRNYRLLTSGRSDRVLDPDAWLAAAEKKEGSWWPAWQNWLAEHSEGRVKARTPGARSHPAICDAPGTYVLMN
jgi:polyhydroxyalkanoate synthase